MRHEPNDVAPLAAETGNAMDRSIGIGGIGHCPCRIAITKYYLPISVQPLDHIPGSYGWPLSGTAEMC